MKYFNVGKIVNTQGLRGEVRVLSVTDLQTNALKKEVSWLFLIKKITLP